MCAIGHMFLLVLSIGLIGISTDAFRLDPADAPWESSSLHGIAGPMTGGEGDKKGPQALIAAGPKGGIDIGWPSMPRWPSVNSNSQANYVSHVVGNVNNNQGGTSIQLGGTAQGAGSKGGSARSAVVVPPPPVGIPPWGWPAGPTNAQSNSAQYVVGNVNNNQGGTSSQLGGTAQGAGSKGGSARSAVVVPPPPVGIPPWGWPAGPTNAQSNSAKYVVGNVNNNQGGTSEQLGGTAQGAGSKGGSARSAVVVPQYPPGGWPSPPAWPSGLARGGSNAQSNKAQYVVGNVNNNQGGSSKQMGGTGQKGGTGGSGRGARQFGTKNAQANSIEGVMGNAQNNQGGFALQVGGTGTGGGAGGGGDLSSLPSWMADLAKPGRGGGGSNAQANKISGVMGNAANNQGGASIQLGGTAVGQGSTGGSARSAVVPQDYIAAKPRDYVQANSDYYGGTAQAFDRTGGGAFAQFGPYRPGMPYRPGKPYRPEMPYQPSNYGNSPNNIQAWAAQGMGSQVALAGSPRAWNYLPLVPDWWGEVIDELINNYQRNENSKTTDPKANGQVTTVGPDTAGSKVSSSKPNTGETAAPGATKSPKPEDSNNDAPATPSKDTTGTTEAPNEGSEGTTANPSESSDDGSAENASGRDPKNFDFDFQAGRGEAGRSMGSFSRLTNDYPKRRWGSKNSQANIISNVVGNVANNQGGSVIQLGGTAMGKGSKGGSARSAVMPQSNAQANTIMGVVGNVANNQGGTSIQLGGTAVGKGSKGGSARSAVMPQSNAQANKISGVIGNAQNNQGGLALQIGGTGTGGGAGGGGDLSELPEWIADFAKPEGGGGGSNAQSNSISEVMGNAANNQGGASIQLGGTGTAGGTGGSARSAVMPQALAMGGWPSDAGWPSMPVTNNKQANLAQYVQGNVNNNQGGTSNQIGGTGIDGGAGGDGSDGPAAEPEPPAAEPEPPAAEPEPPAAEPEPPVGRGWPDQPFWPSGPSNNAQANAASYVVGNVNNNQGGQSSQIGGTAQGAGSQGGGQNAKENGKKY